MSLRRRSVVFTVAAVVVAVGLAPSAYATARPTVRKLSTGLVSAGGGFRLTVFGTGFTDVRAVRFGTTDVKPSSVASATKLFVRVPRHAAGAVDVVVVTGHGTSARTSTDRIRFVGAPAVTSLAPADGGTDGGTVVTVHGKQFYGVSAVTFGRTTGTHVHVVNPQTLTVIAPAHGGGAIDLRVRNTFGTSPVATADRFHYAAPLAPVRDVAVADTTATSALLRWTPSPNAQTVIERDGTVVHTASPTEYEFRDTGLSAGSTHSYTLTATRNGNSSAPVSQSATTETSPRPAMPTGLSIGPGFGNGAPGACSGVPNWVGAYVGTFNLAAYVADPDNPSTLLRGDFELRDLGTSPDATPIDLVTRSDASGQSGSSTSGDLAMKSFAIPLTEGHRYQVDAVTDDRNGGLSRTSAQCDFGYDSQAPAVTVTGPHSAKVGEPVTITVTGTEPTPADGSASGFSHFGYAFGSAAELDGDGGTHVTGTGDATFRTATITFTPTVWGTNYVYVDAHDVAGNTSVTAWYSVYAASS